MNTSQAACACTMQPEEQRESRHPEMETAFGNVD